MGHAALDGGSNHAAMNASNGGGAPTVGVLGFCSTMWMVLVEKAMSIESITEQRKRLNRAKRECTVCGKEMPPRRSSYCSEECYSRNTWSIARARAMRRDDRICQFCGFDSQKLQAVFRTLDWTRRRHLVKTLGFDFHNHWGAGLEVDHIIPRSEGGDNAQDNLRTLCIPCHRTRTKVWHAHRTAARNDAERPLLIS